MGKLLVAAVLLGLVAACASSDADDPEDPRAENPSPFARCPVVTRGGGCRAAGFRERVKIASGGFLLPGAGFATTDGGYLAYALRWGDGRILSSKSVHPWTFDDAGALPLELATGATGVTVGGKNALYFVARSGTTYGLQRSTLDGGVLGAGTPVEVVGASGLPSWPQAVGLEDGRVLLAFVVPQREVMAGVDDGTGVRFQVARVAGGESAMQGVLAQVGTTARGGWVVAYQAADASWHFRSHVLVSHDEGSSWREVLVAADPLADFMNPFPIARRDEGADVYYVKRSTSEQQYTHARRLEQLVFRRALHEDGTLGEEQAVTSSTMGNVANPQPRRLPDGKLAMMLALEKSATEKDLALVVLDGDAP